MEVKSIDNLLNELNDVQLSKESMFGIMGGQEQCIQECHTTRSGDLCITRRDSDCAIIEITLNGKVVSSSSIIGTNDASS